MRIIKAMFGKKAGRSKRDAASLAQSGLFDEPFYREQGPHLGPRPALRHFVQFGNDEPFWPNSLFDPAWYLKRYPDVRATGRNSLAHYIEHGEAEGRQPNALFSPTWYAERNGLPSRAGALRHYLEKGRVAGAKPMPSFDPRAYLDANPHLEISPVDAFAHYLRHGGNQGPVGRQILEKMQETPQRPDTAPEPYRYIAPLKPADLEARISRLARRPLFSVVTPVYNVAPRYLEAAVASVQSQWYPNWELVLVDDASTDPDTCACLDRFDDPKMKVRRQARNGGIAAATNAALDLAEGDYVVFLDNDDVLTPDCLYELARAIAETDADYIYSDEDKIDVEGASTSPFFKPSWSPDAMMSIMYTCHVSCARRSLIAACGGLRSGYDGAQDYDLVLRLTERANRVVHVPKVLYHWRILPSSLAASAEAKPYAHDAARRLKEDALRRRGLAGTVEPVATMPGQYRVNYHPRSGTLVSLIVPTRNNGQLVEALVASVRERTTYPEVEMLFIDNGSTDPQTLATLARLAGEGVTVRTDSRPFNYSALNNSGAAAARGDMLVFMNDDIEVVTPDWLERLVGYAQVPHVGAVGARLHYPSGQIQHCGLVNLDHGPGHAFYGLEAGPPRYYGRDTLEYDWIAVTGACLAIERSKFEAIGGFDVDLPIAYNDVDLCFRLVEAGLYNVVCQSVEMIHHESATRGNDDSPARRARLRDEARRLYARHPRFLGHDPFFSPNLHPNSVYFVPNPN
ncbi:glycosyltransferase family 2 protein [Methylobacterium sp. J-076]|uniref:glycosyltransferase family 2 protein n=1 Tax=Methylobacterium sp. J-076 TaxID=2836655 RepID=UPI001FB8C13F|nr:glycosyltransferase [Methylobacterium sp. J-076]MCJ2013862.1 glycosyltransferase [Methylobacterium sp. J-076]